MKPFVNRDDLFVRLPEAGLSPKQKVGGKDLGFCKNKTFDPGSRGSFPSNPTPLHFLSGESTYHITFMETTQGTQGTTIKLSATAKYNQHILGKERRSKPPLYQHTSQRLFQVCFFQADLELIAFNADLFRGL